MVKDLETKFKYPIAGSLRIGEKNEKNFPQKLDYFTVHNDSHTVDDVVKQFNSRFNKPKELIIKFLSDEPLEVNYSRYGKSGLLCKGDGEKAKFKGDKDWQECECSKECTHRGKDCKLTGRLYFIIKDMDIGGVWRLQTQSYNTIQNFLSTLNFLKCMGVDIKEKEFRLATEENISIVDGKANKYTTISLKMIVSNNKEAIIEKNSTIPKETKEKKTESKKVKTEKEESKTTKVVTENKEDSKTVETMTESKEESKELNDTSIEEDNFEECLTLVEIKDITVGDKPVKQATFCTMKDEMINLLLHPDIESKVCSWEIASVIIPKVIYEKNNNKILKEFKEISITKKAV